MKKQTHNDLPDKTIGKSFSVQFFNGSSISRIFYYTGVFFIGSLMFVSGCVENRMSLKEAKEVTASFSKKEFTPPPRQANDISNILEQEGPATEATKQLAQRADSSPPETATNDDLAVFYYERGIAAKKLGRLKQSLEDFRTAAGVIPENPIKSPILHNIFVELAMMELSLSNFRSCVEAMEKGREKLPSWVGANVFLAILYSNFGEIKSAKKAERRASAIMESWRSSRNHEWKLYSNAQMEASILEAQGLYKKAEPHRQKALQLAIHPKIHLEYPRHFARAKSDMAKNLYFQGRFVEAEVQARQSLMETFKLHGNKSFRSHSIAILLSEILSKQGRYRDAELLLKVLIRKRNDSGNSSDSFEIGMARYALGEVLLEQAKWEDAFEQFSMAKESFKENSAIVKKYFLRTTSYPLALLRTGRGEEAKSFLYRALDSTNKDFGPEDYRSIEIMGLLAATLYETGEKKEALHYYARAIPSYLQTRKGNTQKDKIIFENYIALLSRLKTTGTEIIKGVNTANETFSIAQAASSRSVQVALQRSLSRAALSNPELSGLARREQDAKYQIESLENLLSEHLAAPTDQQFPEVIKDMKERIVKLKKAQKVIRDEVEEKFPRYGALRNPPPATVENVREMLLPGESLIFIYPGTKETYVWAVPKRGNIQFNKAPLSEKNIIDMVTHLRKALDPQPETLGDIPEFDLKTAFKLYSRLLEPVKEGWKNAEELLFVAPGPLGQLPFSVLPTTNDALASEKKTLFANYRKISWLVRKVSITRLPSVSSLITLRTVPEGDPKRKAFAGFGNPIFNLTQLAEAKTKKNLERHAGLAGRIKLRGMRISEKGDLDDQKISSIRLENLNRLSDTAEEIKNIAKATGADMTADIFLGKEASEGRVKTMNLSNRRVIAFATHALLPGDLDGLNQPAIALSAPSVTEDGEDGLLKLQEILTLKLNADWVVLSACNTGAANGEGAEAVSGLGQAFFYAGTRAILASMWPVETTSARTLTTRLFQHQKDDEDLSRARALKKAMIGLIDHHTLKDEVTDKVVASYAHPIFWAPFVVVGDGR
ncbi:CHAT domain-containing protein [Thermodesulfobacteriota bacterium]